MRHLCAICCVCSENPHASTVFSLLRAPQLNILDPAQTKLTQVQNRALRKMMILAIISTDMAHHFGFCKRLDLLEVSDTISQQGAVAGEAQRDFLTDELCPICCCLSVSPSVQSDTLQCDVEDDRQFMMNLITHSSDLSGQVYPLTIATVRESKVTEEFSQQASLETKLGLPLAPFMQNLSNPCVRYKNHVGFPISSCFHSGADWRIYFHCSILVFSTKLPPRQTSTGVPDLTIHEPEAGYCYRTGCMAALD
jgi:hypothetical protein